MTTIYVPPELSPRNSPRVTQVCAAVVDSLYRALTVTCETGRTTGAEFDKVVNLINHRDALILDESTLTTECVGQLLGGN
jgi:hypothetical protein